MKYFDSVDTGFLKLDPKFSPRSKYYTGNIINALIEADTWEMNGQKRYGLLKVNKMNNRDITKILN
jgi:hypothetical protein